MGKRGPIVLRPWTLPVLVAALTLPIVAGFLVAGPGLGVALGALVVTALVIAAARLRPDEPIEVAPGGGDRRHLLVVAGEAIDEPADIEALLEAAGGEEHGLTDQAVVLVLAPARIPWLDKWLSDDREARLAAQRRLVLTLGALAAAGVDARGRVGDADAVQAISDTLLEFPADELIFASGQADRRAAGVAAELKHRLPIPLAHLVIRPPAAEQSQDSALRRP